MGLVDEAVLGDRRDVVVDVPEQALGAGRLDLLSSRHRE
jgi:hypothetical protein